jgi:hypothetical protein
VHTKHGDYYNKLTETPLIPLHFQPSIETVNDYAEDTVRIMKKMYGADLSDLAPSTLKRIDSTLNDWKAGGATTPQVSKSIYAFGAFAGSVLLKARGGEWFKPDQPQNENNFWEYPFLSVRLTTGAVWRPITLGFQIMEGEPNASYWKSFIDLLSSAKPAQ